MPSFPPEHGSVVVKETVVEEKVSDTGLQRVPNGIGQDVLFTFEALVVGDLILQHACDGTIMIVVQRGDVAPQFEYDGYQVAGLCCFHPCRQNWDALVGSLDVNEEGEAQVAQLAAGAHSLIVAFDP